MFIRAPRVLLSVAELLRTVFHEWEMCGGGGWWCGVVHYVLPSTGGWALFLCRRTCLIIGEQNSVLTTNSWRQMWRVSLVRNGGGVGDKKGGYSGGGE